ncbi:MAG: energy transducer TonB [Terriglobus sp.]
MSMVESSGALKTNSRRFVWLTAACNAAVVGAMILVPLLYPEALPRTLLTSVVMAPPSPPHAAAVQPQERPVREVVAAQNPLVAPTHAPTNLAMVHDDALPPAGLVGMGMSDIGRSTGDEMGVASSLGLGAPPPSVVVVPKPKVTKPLVVSSGVIAGNKLSGATPVYPALAKAAHVSGAVVLHAVISKSGEMERLSVVSGPEMLRSSAVAAVQTWRYRPYQLNGEATEVETTITVNFTFGG